MDPLSEVITLLKPRTVYSKLISGAGSWAVRYSAFEQPSFCTMLEGECVLAVEGQEPISLVAGDFVLMPATPGFTLSGLAPAVPVLVDPKLLPSPQQEEIRHGDSSGPPDARMLGGFFVFDSADASWMVKLLPALLHLRGITRLSLLVQLVREESLEQKPGRDLVLARLVEILLIEALRAAPGKHTPPGLLRALADTRLAAVLRYMHGDPSHAWTVVELARIAALSRSAFFDRFQRTVGSTPMDYLFAWRMAIAKNLLGQNQMTIAQVAERVGYSCASTFSTAFSRHTGRAPGHFARLQ